MEIETLLTRFKNIKKSGSGWVACCPAHKDGSPSLSITPNGNKILLHCHAGCSTESIVSAMGLQMKDLFLDEPKARTERQETEYKYTDETGNHVFSVHRIDEPGHEKKIWQKPAQGRTLADVKHYPYHLPEVLAAIEKSETILICEGEKCCDACREKLEAVATTNSGGAEKWADKHSEFLKGASVVILPDNDGPGQRHAEKTAQSLLKYGAKVKIVPLPGLGEKGDVVDWLAAGGTRAGLEKLIDGAPIFSGNDIPTDPTTGETFPAPVWGSHYNEHGIPDKKPELIGGVLRRSHKMLIGAPSKAAKSFLAIRLAVSIASGRDFLSFPCTKGNVYYINFELDEGSFLHRVKAVCDAMNLPMPENILYHHLRGECCEIEKLLPALSKQCEGNDFSAIILDPQYKMLQSNQIKSFSENDTQNMGYLYGQLDSFFARQNISPIIISHFAKGSAIFKEQIDRVAGSGVMARDVDTLMTFSGLETDDCYRMEFSCRDFKTPDPLSVQWIYPLHVIDPMLDGVSLRRPGKGTTAPNIDDEVILQTIVSMNGRANQSAIKAAVECSGIKRARVENALSRLTTSGKLTTSKGEHNAIFYQVA